jgi:hypothetical protein
MASGTHVYNSLSFACHAERLARTRSRPDGSIVRPSRPPQGITPHPDPGKEMTLGISGKLIWPNVLDTPLIHHPRRNHPRPNQLPKPPRRKRINLVIKRRHAPTFLITTHRRTTSSIDSCITTRPSGNINPRGGLLTISTSPSSGTSTVRTSFQEKRLSFPIRHPRIPPRKARINRPAGPSGRTKKNQAAKRSNNPPNGPHAPRNVSISSTPVPPTPTISTKPF